MSRTYPIARAALFAAVTSLLVCGTTPLLAQGTGNTTNASPNSGILAGSTNTANLVNSGFIGAGRFNQLIGGRDSALIAGSNNLVTSNSANSFIGAGNNNTVIGGFNTVIVAGVRNTNFAGKSVIVGGQQNLIGSNSRSSTVAGGEFNTIEAINPVLGLQTGNLLFATVGGGQRNLISSNGLAATIGGGTYNTATAGYSIVGGGESNSATANWSVVSGGFFNQATGQSSFIGGGEENLAAEIGTIVVGGAFNQANAADATVISGYNNRAQATNSFIGAGQNNEASSPGAIVLGGNDNSASGANSVVGGGRGNWSGGDHATIPGGLSNSASGVGSFSAGVRAKATNDYSFVWGGSPNVDTVSTNPMSYTARAPGGFRLMTSTNDIAGMVLPANSSTWASLSDSNAKTDIRAVDYRNILAKVASLPVTEWRYKHDPTRRYIGPMAQDFHAAFGLGSDDKTISTLDTDGVTLAAIKGLVQELDEQDRTLSERESQINRLEKSLQMLRDQLPPSSTPSF